MGSSERHRDQMYLYWNLKHILCSQDWSVDSNAVISDSSLSCETSNVTMLSSVQWYICDMNGMLMQCTPKNYIDVILGLFVSVHIHSLLGYYGQGTHTAR